MNKGLKMFLAQKRSFGKYFRLVQVSAVHILIEKLFHDCASRGDSAAIFLKRFPKLELIGSFFIVLLRTHEDELIKRFEVYRLQMLSMWKLIQF